MQKQTTHSKTIPSNTNIKKKRYLSIHTQTLLLRNKKFKNPKKKKQSLLFWYNWVKILPCDSSKTKMKPQSDLPPVKTERLPPRAPEKPRQTKSSKRMTETGWSVEESCENPPTQK